MLMNVPARKTVLKLALADMRKDGLCRCGFGL